MRRLLWILLLMGAPAAAATRWVGGCGPGAGYATIQAAIDAASAGDTISICPGTYTSASSIVVNKPNLTITSSTGNRADVRIENGSATVIYIDAEHTTLSNLTVYSNPRDAIHARSGADHLRLLGVSADSEYGTGLKLENIRDIRLSGHRSGASNWQGAIRLIGSGPLTVDGDSRIFGSWVGIFGDAGRDADLTLDGVSITAPYPVYLARSGQVRATDSTITATYRGGGGWAMTLWGGGGKAHRFDNLSVTGSHFGGGILLDGGSASFTDVDIESRGDWPGEALKLLNMDGDVSIRAVRKSRVRLIASSTVRHSYDEHAINVSARYPLTLSLEKVDLTAHQNGIWQQGSGVTLQLNDVGIDAGRHGVYVVNGRGAHRLDHVTLRTASIGLYLQGGSDARLENLDITAQTGVRLANQSQPKILGASRVTLQGANGYGILVEGGSNADLSGVEVDAADQPDAIGIYLFDSPSGSIHGNRVSRAKKEGILVNVNSRYARVWGNSIENSGQSGGRYGLYLDGYGARARDNCLFNPRNGHAGFYAEFYDSSVKHGNFWGSWPKGSGYSDSCADAGHDGVCDLPYAYQSGKRDEYPMRSLPDCAGSGGGAGAPGGFNAFETGTPSGAITGVIKTKVAGSAFGLDVVALNLARTAVETGFSGDVTVQLLGNTATGVALDANHCPLTSTLIQSGTASISGGRSTVGFAPVANVWRDVRVRVLYPATAPTLTACSTDNFAIRPSGFTLAATDADWEHAGTARVLNNAAASGGVIHKAGRPFTLTVVAQPAGATQYDGSPTVKSKACSLPSPCTTGSLSLGAFGGSGTRTSSTASYGEVGTIALELEDAGFAAVDADDSTAAERTVPQQGGAVTVGRFVPDHFDLAYNTPVFETACGGFTYLGQPFDYATAPRLRVTASNAAGAPTVNYAGALFKLTAAGITGQTYHAAAGTVEAVAGSLPAPTVTDLGAGVGSVDFSVGDAGAGGGLRFVRGNTPLAPFDAELALSFSLADSEGVSPVGNPVTFGAATPGAGIAFDGGKSLRFGRLRLANAYGSELLPLPVPLTAQYWNGQGFVSNGDDHCTVLPALAAVARTAPLSPGLTFYGQSADNQLAAGETWASFASPLVSGNANLVLAAPGAGNHGYLDLVADAPVWLEYNWDGVDQAGDGKPLDDNPRARAAFGKRRGADRLILRREIY